MADDRTTTKQPSEADPGPPSPRHAFHMPADADSGAKAAGAAGMLAAARRRAAGIFTASVSVITTVVVATLAVHIVFVAFEANPDNELVNTVSEWARGMAWQFKDVFQPADPKIEVVVNYGLAAVVYLVVGRLLIGLVRRLD